MYILIDGSTIERDDLAQDYVNGSTRADQVVEVLDQGDRSPWFVGTPQEWFHAFYPNVWQRNEVVKLARGQA